MKYPFYILIVALIFSACAGEDETHLDPQLPAQTTHDEFFANLFSICGETFSGESTYPDEPEHPLVDTELNATISTCTDDRIEIDLQRDGDTWHATWILSKRDDGLHLYHDHIGERVYDEGEEPLTGYGGYADDRGSSTQQFFPADEFTAEILPEAATNVWMMDMDLENGVFVYYLERHDEPRFRAELNIVD